MTRRTSASALYIALSEVNVSVGQAVTAGQVIGLAGGMGWGCTNRERLLGFAVLRDRSNSGVRQWTDPFGYQGPGEDPWVNDPSGAPSVWLWMTAPTFTPLPG